MFVYFLKLLAQMCLLIVLLFVQETEKEGGIPGGRSFRAI